MNRKLKRFCKKRNIKYVPEFYKTVRDLRQTPTKDPLTKKGKRKPSPIRDLQETLAAEERKSKKPPKSIPISPSLGTRICLHQKQDPTFEEIFSKPKYVPPRPKNGPVPDKPKKEERSKIVQLTRPTSDRKLEKTVEAPSLEIPEAKVNLKQATPTSSMAVALKPDKSELDRTKPKTGTFINETQDHQDKLFDESKFDSFDLVFHSTARPKTVEGMKQIKKEKRDKNLTDIEEETLIQNMLLDDTGDNKYVTKRDSKGSKASNTERKSKSKGTKQRRSSDNQYLDDAIEQFLIEEEIAMHGEDMDEEAIETYLTKQFRKKVSQISKSTSYKERDIYPCPLIDMTSEEVLQTTNLDKTTQKFRVGGESEVAKRKFRRGTLESHSFTQISQPFVKDFYFGTKCGTMHQGDNSLKTNNLQGICIPVAAYCYSMIKHPIKWETKDIDTILLTGNTLYTQCLDDFHIHEKREVGYQELNKYCYIGDKKVRFIVDEPEVSGLLFSNYKTVFNFTKALNIFFHRQNAGIFLTKGVHMALWKDKHYYCFDGTPRTKDLSSEASGTATMATFYDLQSLVTVLLQRSGYGNWPFVIYSIRVLKVLNRDVDSRTDICDFDNVRSNYNIISDDKAVVLATFHLADLCFKFTRNKQAVALAAVALVYSRITPAAAWHRTTLDKIMIIGNKLCEEIIQGDTMIQEVKLSMLPAYFSMGPYIVEIYIHENLMSDTVYKKCKCQLRFCVEEFFQNSTNAILQIDKYTFGIFKQRSKYYLFDPYSRNFEGLMSKDGVACVSMHGTTESLVDVLLANLGADEMVFFIHALKVCKIIRDPLKDKKFPKCQNMNDISINAFKDITMIKGQKKAVHEPVAADFSRMATQLIADDESQHFSSIFRMGQNVESLQFAKLPVPEKIAIKEVLQPSLPNEEPPIMLFDLDEVIDLDSPSLMDTQVAPPPLEDSEDEQELEFMDLCSFDLTMDEIEIEPPFDQEAAEDEIYPPLEIVEPASPSFGTDDGSGDYKIVCAEEKKELGEGDFGQIEDEWYYSASRFAQVGSHSLDFKYIGKVSEMVNTDITAFPTELQVLYPTYIRGKLDKTKTMLETTQGDWEFINIAKEADVTQSQELAKETNFVLLPDDTELIRGTKNLAEHDDDVEFMAPFVCIMAAAVAKKYSIITWSPEIVDYILKCGYDLYKSSNVRYDQVTKLEIPKISLGKADFKVMVKYIFDSYMKEKMLQLAIEKILFVRSNVGILVTPTYACTIFVKNHLFYLFDGFGNNEVGLSEGPDNDGAACVARFKTIPALVMRIMYNKKKREMDELVEYSRFVLSAVKVKTLIKKDTEKQIEEKEPDEAEDEMEEDLLQQEEDGEEPKPKPKKKHKKNKVGYQFKNGIYIIEGTSALVDRAAVTGQLKKDHFICLCACLMLFSCPIKEWDTKTVDEVIEHGEHVFNHAEDLEISEKRSIRNVLIGKNFFDIIVKRIHIEHYKNNRNLSCGVETMLMKKLSYFLVQFPNACYVVHKSGDGCLHLFDAYGPPSIKKKKNKNNSEALAAWVRCKDVKSLKTRLKKIRVKDAESYSFYNFEVTSIKKAPKDIILSHKLHQYQEKKEKDEKYGKPFYEDVEWLKTDPIPWTRTVLAAANGATRGVQENKWNNWDIEYDKDLYSMVGNIHQAMERFPVETRGKQTLNNLIVCIGMLQIYEMEEWSPAILDSVLVNGNNYFIECTKEISDEDYEIFVDDLKEDCTIFPFQFKIAVAPAAKGTMFLMRVTQFNLYKALRYFFSDKSSRYGIVCVNKGVRIRQVAFGKTRKSEYFVFDCDSFGPPMFPDNWGVSYILRTTTLNRLLHVLVLTLRGGDFYIFEVKVADLKPIA